MLPPRIKAALEHHAELRTQLQEQGLALDWAQYNRTSFDFIARRINRVVTSAVLQSPTLLRDYLIIGKHQVRNLMLERRVRTADELLANLTQQKKSITWISGKTLQSYWHEGIPKDTRVNVLLTFLGVDPAAWDEWKGPARNTPARNTRRSHTTDLIRQYFLGSYFLYYQKSDGSPYLIKAPFRIALDDRGNVFAETTTEGHPYRSTLLEIRDGILYIHCENQVFDEKENHIFNVGNETNPEILFGISNTITVKQKLAIGLRNVLIKQRQPFTASTYREREISLGALPDNDEEQLMVRYFQTQSINQLQSRHCCTRQVLAASLTT